MYQVRTIIQIDLQLLIEWIAEGPYVDQNKFGQIEIVLQI